MEKWKHIKEYKGYYQVSNTGKIRSLDRVITYTRNGSQIGVFVKGYELSGSITGCGYLRVHLIGGSSKKSILVHRLVAKAFRRTVKDKLFINHLDGNKLNNHVSNLVWCTHAENIQHAFDTGLNSHKGSSHTKSIFSEMDVLFIHEIIIAGGTSFNQISNMYGVQEAAISSIATGRTWTHITGIEYISGKPYTSRKSRSVRNDRGEVFDSITIAADHFNLNRPSQISNVLNGNSNYAGKYPDTNVGIKWFYADNGVCPNLYSNKGRSLNRVPLVTNLIIADNLAGAK